MVWERDDAASSGWNDAGKRESRIIKANEKIARVDDLLFATLSRAELALPHPKRFWLLSAIPPPPPLGIAVGRLSFTGSTPFDCTR